MKSSEVYNIVLAPSKMIYKQAMVVMMSAIANCKNKCHFYIMQCNWTKEEKTICENFVAAHPGHSVSFIDVDNKMFDKLKPWRGFHNTYYKIIAHCFMPDTVERFLYLDCDAIVLKDIEKFYSMDFKGNYLIACTEEISLEGYKQRSDKNERAKHGFFNGGVVLFNAKKFREEKITIEFYTKVAQALPDGEYFVDQGLLSHIFYDKTIVLPSYKYNHVMYQEGAASKPYSFKYVFSLSKQERKDKVCPPYWNEDYDESQDSTIVHWAGYVSKPWQCLVYKRDEKFELDIPVLRHGLVKTDVERYYVKWWEIAEQLPADTYAQILMECISAVAKDYLSATSYKDSLTWMTNAKNFFEQLSQDCFSRNRVKNFLASLENKKVCVLKANDAAGKFVIQNLASTTQVVFKSGKARLAELTESEWKMCKTADVIICCCVHGTFPEARDGIKPIMIKDILNDELWSSDTPSNVSIPGQEPMPNVSTKALEAKVRALTDQNARLSADLAETSAKLGYANELSEVLRSECSRLQQTVSSMENSRSWRYTRIFRKKKK